MHKNQELPGAKPLDPHRGSAPGSHCPHWVHKGSSATLRFLKLWIVPCFINVSSTYFYYNIMVCSIFYEFYAVKIL